MALMACPSCGKDVSSQAQSCPNCGHPFGSVSPAKPKKSFVRQVIETVGALAIVFVILAVVVGKKKQEAESSFPVSQSSTTQPPESSASATTDLSVDEPHFEVTGITNHTCHSGTQNCRAILCEYTNHTSETANKMLIVFKNQDGKTTSFQQELATLEPEKTAQRYYEVPSPEGDTTKYGCTTRNP